MRSAVSRPPSSVPSFKTRTSTNMPSLIKSLTGESSKTFLTMGGECLKLRPSLPVGKTILRRGGEISSMSPTSLSLRPTWSDVAFRIFKSSDVDKPAKDEPSGSSRQSTMTPSAMRPSRAESSRILSTRGGVPLKTIFRRPEGSTTTPPGDESSATSALR
eukprot:scaffold166479_cov58-Attheya_sp.AAC.2